MAKQLEQIKSECSECMLCPLGQTRTNIVFGVGNPNAELMFVGEAPGESEDLTGIPFVGRAGKLFDKFLLAVGIDRNEVYIANILKCRPPQNRDPKPEEEDLCTRYLDEQIEAIKPKYIVCLGRIAAMRLIKEDFRIMSEHGVWFEKEKYKICAVLHPSAILRDPRKNELMLKDMMNIRDVVFGEERH
ncbi:MAG: uracil-DNA glycosylase [Clostridiales bacterium]|nr:uracil-DNA glycosylase [Clostridiales bacterium]